MELRRGQKVDITKNNTTQVFRFHTKWQAKKEMDVDISAFLLDTSDRCRKDGHFVFYGQPQSIDNSVSYQSKNQNEGLIEIAFQKIPEDVEKIALTLTIHDGDELDLRFRDIEEASLLIEDARTNEVLHTFSFKGGLEQETAIVIGELYRHNGEWKLNAVGSGFFGGLFALCENFGLQVASETAQQEDTVQETPVVEELPASTMSMEEEQVSPTPAFQQQLNIAEPASMNILLEKGQSISTQSPSTIMAIFEWMIKKKELDVDLYCFYVLQSGETGKVYYRHLGSASSDPYMTLDVDAETPGKRTVVIHQPSKLKYVLFASYKPLTSGAHSFKKIEAKLVIDNRMGQQVTTTLYENNRYAYWAAIARMDFTKANDLVISQVECYSRPGSEKSPVLNEDGTFMMDKGPIEFK